MDFYIASCCQDGKILQCRLDNGKMNVISSVKLGWTMYLAHHNKKMWAISRETAGLSTDSSIFKYEISDSGSLQNAELLGSTSGKEACHLCVGTNDDVYCVNYTSGSVKKFPDTVVAHQGSGLYPDRQSEPHPHFIDFIPNTSYLCVADLGCDKIMVYNKNMELISSASVKPGQGPRHIAFSKDGSLLYCVNELGSTVSVFSHDNGNLQHIKDYSTLPDNCDCNSSAAAIRLSKDGKFLYVSNRGHDSIAWFSVAADRLDFCGAVSCEGVFPRDFNITESLLICTNERSDDVTLFQLENGKPVFTGEKLYTKAPLCVVF